MHCQKKLWLETESPGYEHLTVWSKSLLALMLVILDQYCITFHETPLPSRFVLANKIVAFQSTLLPQRHLHTLLKTVCQTVAPVVVMTHILRISGVQEIKPQQQKRKPTPAISGRVTFLSRRETNALT